MSFPFEWTLRRRERACHRLRVGTCWRRSKSRPKPVVNGTEITCGTMRSRPRSPFRSSTDHGEHHPDADRPAVPATSPRRHNHRLRRYERRIFAGTTLLLRTDFAHEVLHLAAEPEARKELCDAICGSYSWIMTIIHELLAETVLGQPDSGGSVWSGAVRRPASALMQRRLPSLSRDAMPSLREGAHTEEQSMPK